MTKKQTLLAIALTGLLGGLAVENAYAGEGATPGPHAEGEKDSCKGSGGCGGKDSCKGKEGCKGKSKCSGEAKKHTKGDKNSCGGKDGCGSMEK